MNAAVRSKAKSEDNAAVAKPRRAPKKVTISEVSRGYPLEAMGMIEGKAFYLRDRDGLEVRIGTPDPKSPIGMKLRGAFWWGPDFPDEEIVRLVRRAFEAYTLRKTKPTRKVAKPSNDAG